MGKKGGTGGGVNTKVAAANEKKAQAAGVKADRTRASQEAAEARDWAQGSNQRGSKREDDAARKQDEKLAKISAKKALEDAEAKDLSGLKSVVVRKGTDSTIIYTTVVCTTL